ncbi:MULTISPECIES: ribonuclease HI [Roseivirga]|jgi:ribonuclease HI|uniref:ribonuclease H n=1 Tax=Roseivirga spongicola TaxID=333140 RepID=A0A150XBL4_9BACT|nr:MULTISPECIES: ribonuclease HI [Roseivirga]KYG76070.1 ribonuclease HI [Roseivirga spongicola]MBO6494286.1 ribonuclease HI [Roseivirga sp.]MBO6659259.1 ribonuclease HI [Roseivirga sp.]MBO6760960.1 ribonuclease HI [Roseivirga sp.]MBO6908004.1 ribonuclease HI [Roseivirga sp.]|tara:strand:+ start:91 stop:549 length:459 start_codon:yes stop_codon:yes gene_type:complete
MITIYTDGSSRGNPGPGGYGVVMKFREHRKEISQGYRKTTNNRMELLAIIVGLESIKVPNAPVKIYSDSKYVIDSVTKGWLWGWIKKDFKGKKNKDLWLRFVDIYNKHRVTFQWVKGHAGIPENERCDQLAVDAAEGSNLLVDEGFESGLYS